MPVAGYCVILIMSCVLQVGSLVLLPKKAAESCFACCEVLVMVEVEEEVRGADA